MPITAMRQAEALTMSADLYLSIGSSLVRGTAAGFPLMAKRNGAALVIINREPTEFDDVADLVIRHDIGETLPGPAPVFENKVVDYVIELAEKDRQGDDPRRAQPHHRGGRQRGSGGAPPPSGAATRLKPPFGAAFFVCAVRRWLADAGKA